MYPVSPLVSARPSQPQAPTLPAPSWEAEVPSQMGPVRSGDGNLSVTARPALWRRDAFLTAPPAPVDAPSPCETDLSTASPATPPSALLSPCSSPASGAPVAPAVATPAATPSPSVTRFTPTSFWAEASAFLPLVPSPLAHAQPPRFSKLALMRGGDQLYLANPHKSAGAVHCWLLALVGDVQQREDLFFELSQQVSTGLGPQQEALHFFHMACLMSDKANAQELFRFAHISLPDLAAVTEQMLAQAKKQRAFAGAMAGVHTHLYRNFGLLVGEPAAEQASLWEALYSGDFGRANLLSERMQISLPHLPVVHWARFVCEFEALRGQMAQRSFLTAKSRSVFWARGLLFTMMGLSKTEQVLAQGALDLYAFRSVWQLFLDRYFLLAPQDFVAPDHEVVALGLAGEAARKLHGVYWNDLLAVPYPDAWPNHRANLEAHVAAAVGQSTAIADLPLPALAAARRMTLE